MIPQAGGFARTGYRWACRPPLTSAPHALRAIPPFSTNPLVICHTSLIPEMIAAASPLMNCMLHVRAAPSYRGWIPELTITSRFLRVERDIIDPDSYMPHLAYVVAGVTALG